MKKSKLTKFKHCYFSFLLHRVRSFMIVKRHRWIDRIRRSWKNGRKRKTYYQYDRPFNNFFKIHNLFHLTLHFRPFLTFMTFFVFDTPVIVPLLLWGNLKDLRKMLNYYYRESHVNTTLFFSKVRKKHRKWKKYLEFDGHNGWNGPSNECNDQFYQRYKCSKSLMVRYFTLFHNILYFIRN